MATSAAGCPVMRQVCGPAGWSKGKHRNVACVSSFTRFSSASLPHHPPRAHFPARECMCVQARVQAKKCDPSGAWRREGSPGPMASQSKAR